jgi:transposase
MGNPSKAVVRSLKRSVTQLKKEIKILEDKLLVLVKRAHQDLLTSLKTSLGVIPN